MAELVVVVGERAGEAAEAFGANVLGSGPLDVARLRDA